MKKGNLASSVAAKTKEAQAQAKAAAKAQGGAAAKNDVKTFDNYEIALQIMKARRRNEEDGL